MSLASGLAALVLLTLPWEGMMVPEPVSARPSRPEPIEVDEDYHGPVKAPSPPTLAESKPPEQRTSQDIGKIMRKYITDAGPPAQPPVEVQARPSEPARKNQATTKAQPDPAHVAQAEPEDPDEPASEEREPFKLDIGPRAEPEPSTEPDGIDYYVWVRFDPLLRDMSQYVSGNGTDESPYAIVVNPMSRTATWVESIPDTQVKGNYALRIRIGNKPSSIAKHRGGAGRQSDPIVIIGGRGSYVDKWIDIIKRAKDETEAYRRRAITTRGRVRTTSAGAATVRELPPPPSRPVTVYRADEGYNPEPSGPIDPGNDPGAGGTSCYSGSYNSVIVGSPVVRMDDGASNSCYSSSYNSGNNPYRGATVVAPIVGRGQPVITRGTVRAGSYGVPGETIYEERRGLFGRRRLTPIHTHSTSGGVSYQGMTATADPADCPT